MARLRGASIPTLPMSQSTQSLSPRRDYHSQILTSHHLKVRQNINYYIILLYYIILYQLLYIEFPSLSSKNF